MNDITGAFGTLYLPKKAFVVYQQEGQEKHIYIESYDMDGGYPVNAHPLSVKESIALAKALDTSEDLTCGFLKPGGLLPKNVLYINPDTNGYAVWHTPQQTVNMLFTETLGIPNGRANVPALLWKASKECLYIYALKNDTGLHEQEVLYHAPFFNVYESGKVCMGTVNIHISPDCRLEAFMRQWESYFFNSYFSHLFEKHNPVKGNIVQLWHSLAGGRKKFPKKSLVKNGRTIKNILL
jgi:PRTRC genetic system protein B